MERTALVIGASGLIGLNVARLLLDDSEYGAVNVIVRWPMPIYHAKLVQHVINFEELARRVEENRAHDVFCTLDSWNDNS